MQNPLRYEIQTAFRNHLRPERGKQDRGRQCQAAVGCRELTMSCESQFSLHRP